MKQHESDLPAGVTIEPIRRDDTGPQSGSGQAAGAGTDHPRHHVQILAGVIWTPNALAIAPLATEAKVPLIIMNASTSTITTKSPYIARVSLTIVAVVLSSGSLGGEERRQEGLYRGVGLRTWDRCPEQAFTRGFVDSGGQIVGSMRMPVANPDFVPFLQRAKDVAPDAVFAFVPAGKRIHCLDAHSATLN